MDPRIDWSRMNAAAVRFDVVAVAPLIVRAMITDFDLSVEFASYVSSPPGSLFSHRRYGRRAARQFAETF